MPADLPPPTFHLDGGRVAPQRAFYGGRPHSVRVRFSAAAPTDVRIEIRRRGGGLARRFDVRAVAPPGPVQVRWDGRVRGGREAREGRFRVLAGRRGGRLRAIGSFSFRRHVYPVQGSAARSGSSAPPDRVAGATRGSTSTPAAALPSWRPGPDG